MARTTLRDGLDGSRAPVPPLPTPRRRKQKMPSWYVPQREDPASLPSGDELEQSLRAFEEEKQQSSRIDAGATGVVTALPRRQLAAPKFSMPQLMMQREYFTASFLRTLLRFGMWLFAGLRYLSGVLWDKLWRRDSEQSRAARLLSTIQSLGGTWIKFGQQLAMRVDVLPYAYCVELSKLFDSMPSFPVRQAIAAIERATGRRLKEVFARFDPEPIGSASVACVYQAVLRSGEQVAVKVRRPGIGTLFAADLRAMGWIVGMVEWLAIIRPGNLRTLVRELEASFLEELDLRREAYSQEIFRRYSQDPKVSRRRFFSAPRVFFEYTSNEVIVQDFVSGIWLWEILAAIEQGDERAQARMQELQIDPRVVARRLMWVAMWGNLANVLFHADPHPANIIVQANNHIIFVDFGACGYVSAKKRNLYTEFFRAQTQKDVSGMARVAISMLEPLPPIDLDALEKDIERVYYEVSATMWSKQARWWERTSAMLWLRLMELTRQYNLPVNADTVKIMRASLLYDTLALRLDNDLNINKQWRRYWRDAMHITGSRMRRSMRKRVLGGLQLEDYAHLEELSRLGASALAQLRRFVDHPPFTFNYSIDKPVYVVITAVKVMMLLSITGCAVTGIWAAGLLLLGKSVSVLRVASLVVTSRPFQALIVAALLVGLRRVMFRLNDRDI